MMKIIKIIIETCYRCPYRYNGKCFFEGEPKPIIVKEKWFPEWCPLENYEKSK